MTKTLTPLRFDAALARPKADRIIWTLPAIGQRIGRGRDFVSALAATPGSPIKRRGRQYYVFESELLSFLAKPD